MRSAYFFVSDGVLLALGIGREIVDTEACGAQCPGDRVADGNTFIALDEHGGQHQDQEPGKVIEPDVDVHGQRFLPEPFEAGGEQGGDGVENVVTRDQVHETHADDGDLRVVGEQHEQRRSEEPGDRDEQHAVEDREEDDGVDDFDEGFVPAFVIVLCRQVPGRGPERVDGDEQQVLIEEEQGEGRNGRDAQVVDEELQEDGEDTT